MTTKSDKSDRRIAVNQRAALQTMPQTEVEQIIRTMVPGGQNLTSAQVAGAAMTARTTGLNPALGEFHMTNLGPMQAAKQVAGWAYEWMRATGEREPEFTYTTAGQLRLTELVAQVRAWGREIADDADLQTAFRALCEVMNYNPAIDVAVLVRMYRFSTREAWNRNVHTALLLGSRDEVRAMYGLSPAPDHEAWGVVRFDEYAFEKVNGKKMRMSPERAQAAWQDAGAKFNHLERAKKRGRTACIRAAVPVLAETILRQREGSRTTQVIRQSMSAASAPNANDMPTVTMPHTHNAGAVDAMDGEVRDADVDVAVFDDAMELSIEPIERDEDIPGDVDDDIGASTDEDNSDTPAFAMPEALRESALIIEAGARAYAENNRETNEKQNKLINVNLSKLTGKDGDELKHALLKALTGFEHYGDVPGPYRLALLNQWLKLTPTVGGYPEPCARAKSDVATLVKVMAASTGQEEMVR